MAGSVATRDRRLAEASRGAARLLERLNLTPTGGAAIALVAAGWLGARLMGSRTAFLMVYASILAVVLAWFVSRRRLAFDITRSALPSRMRVDQVIGVELAVTAHKRATTIVLEEQLHPRLGTTVSIPVGSIRPGGGLRHRYSLTPSLRGVYQVGPLVARWSDPFGFTTHHQVLAEAVEVVVHPSVEPVHDRVLTRMWEDPPVRPPVSKPWPVGFEFYGMRDYVPGDDLRRVVWSVFARTGKLMVRESEQGITDRVVVYLDTGREWHSPGEVSETFEAAVRTAASVGVRHLDDGFSVTLLTNRGRVISGLRGAQAHLEYLDQLARVELDDATMSDVGHLLLEEAKSRPHMLVVTPRLSRAEAQRLKLVVDRGVSTVVAQVTWDESDPSTLSNAAALGCEVVKVPVGASLEGVFARQVGAGRR